MDYQKDNNVREEYRKLDISDRKEQEEDDEEGACYDNDLC